MFRVMLSGGIISIHSDKKELRILHILRAGFLTVPSGCPCTYSDAVLFAGSIVAFPHVCC